MLIVGALIVTAWFMLSFPVAVIVGRMLAAGHPPTPQGGVLVRLDLPTSPSASGPRTAS